MTQRKHLKRRVRERAAKTGESYTAALWSLRRAEEATTMSPRNHPNENHPNELALACSFCRKSADDVEKLVAGPGVFICDECIDLAASIVESERRATSEEPPVPLSERPTTELLAIFGGLAKSTDRTIVATRAWAAALAERGVTDEQLAEAAGTTIEELHAHLRA